ncbi:DUF2156 domain-containing protein [Candidatus Omnitrophota bacterium]
MRLRELRLQEDRIFKRFLKPDEYHLSAYHTASIFIWKKLFRISYVILDGSLCIFFQDRHSCFMHLPPLGQGICPGVINKCFAIMDKLNKNNQISRIENVEERDLAFFRKLGYVYYAKPADYLYNREDILSFRGRRFKSKRADYNYFVKHHDFKFRPYCREDKVACLDLYLRWSDERKRRFSDSLYRAMLEDNYSCQELALENFLRLGLIGYVVEIKDKLSAYSCGFRLNSEIFCVLSEVCSLGYRGISQYIFSEFCRCLTGFRYINAMDDSGLVNLRRVKLSYRPARLIDNYIIQRRYA